jgi:phosphoribosyl 1,2-cyclic phosphodiesterase
MKLFFQSLASGSSGNCYYLGTPEYGILIDAGISLTKIKKTLDKQIDCTKIVALLVTHDHADHIKGFLDKHWDRTFPIYSTEDVYKGICKSRYGTFVKHELHQMIKKETPFTIQDFRITPFEVPHDSTDNVGYLIEYGAHAFTFATDVGHITDTVCQYIHRANHLIIEANYDNEMLRQGTYPQFLKDRVSSPTGHLSNNEAAECLAAHYHPELRDIWLCHLSRDNNHPELARKTVEDRLFNEGIRVGKDVNLTPLKRTTPSDLYVFE